MNQMIFKTRSDFRAWLTQNALNAEGVWLIFGKTKNLRTITAAEALEEALCFGWIDGLLQSVDADSYQKYFKQRDIKSNWSDKNRALAEELETRGLMTDFGRAKIQAAKQSGRYAPPKPDPMSEEDIRRFEALLAPHALARENYDKMPPSARKIYAAAYHFTKTEAGKMKRLATTIERLEKNLDPMTSMKRAQEPAREQEDTP